MPGPTMAADLLLMLLADARLPVAGHTQSAGLEPAVLGGLTSAGVPLYLGARLDTVTRVEAATAVVALHHLRQAISLEPVTAAWAARTPSQALRHVSRTQGRALHRLLRRLWPEHPAVVAVGGATAPRAVVLAAAADAAGLSPAALARLVGYDDAQTVAAAALKLLPMDPADATGWVLDALPLIEDLAADVAALTEPGDIPASGAPQFEAWAQAHATATRRLFSA
ncbi:urease accessory protein UreF [Nocardioides sp. Kera G14]|uniref:urease accessory protein UreF n=1 Tax=Nocardioides sp. Kera G14 TaxID=2884264 RepID=UPI001D0F80B9|nr:urease accessory UreF family protein [Nocardioides sp. Kera G14]UDY25210.1 urease accessory protein UreF [Nocardioides sp. Kera G14]